MTKYVQLRESNVDSDVREFLAADARRVRMVTDVANGLMNAWFPKNNPGPVGEDLQNWQEIAIQDAAVAVKTLLEGAWIDDPTMD